MSDQLIMRLKEIASENYSVGGDYMVECWDDSDWQRFIDDYPLSAVKELYELIALKQSIEDDIRGEIF